MKSALRVAAPPAKPLMIYDGDCNFCALWIHRWQETTGDRVEYLAFQEPSVAERFPELPRTGFEAAVHLIDTDGTVYSGAAAAFRTLAQNPRERWLLDWYVHSPAFAGGTEWCYRQVAAHRRFFSALTFLCWGRQVGKPAHSLVRWVFLRGLGVAYFVAFVSLWVQIAGLIGSNGILPARLTMAAAQQQAASAHVGWDSYHWFPTLCWVNAGDGFLKFQCVAGTTLSVLLIIGVAPVPCLFLLWLIYLSLATIGREFLGFQWDILLLEIGFLAIFFAPLQLLPRLARAPPPSRVVLWLLRWLLFRLMFASGCVKLLSGDSTWRNLTALNYHYETQPLPTWLGWYAHQLPASVQKASTVVMFGIELGLPFLIFAPRRLRQIACGAFVMLQLAILLTGNYCFFNLLTLALCVVLLDDAALSRLWSWLNKLKGLKGFIEFAKPVPASKGSGGAELRLPFKWPIVVTAPLACVVVLISGLQFCGMFGLRLPWPRPVATLYQWLLPFRSVNSYGLFAVMTTNRLEIVIEGSTDGVTWREYEFKYKPGDLKRRPAFVEPHQPRLDWQMWFAALGSYRQNPWLVNFCARLLQGSPEALALLERNPFPTAPPRYLRAVVYAYHFTDFAARRQTGAWWRRERKGDYLPVISLQDLE